MQRNIKLIWDFYGPDSKNTAAHHIIHLREFAEKNHIEHGGIDEEIVNESHTSAFMVVNEAQMITVRDSLKPHRGMLVP